MEITEQVQAQFDAAVETNVRSVERLVTVMSQCPYTERNELIAALAGVVADSKIPDGSMTAIAVTATIMLMLERQRS